MMTNKKTKQKRIAVACLYFTINKIDKHQNIYIINNKKINIGIKNNQIDEIQSLMK